MIGDSSPLTDGNGHGTHVAGVIGALNNSIGVVGAAPDAEIYSVKVLGSDGAGKLENVLNGIQWAIDQEMDIINLSLTTEKRYPGTAGIIKESISTRHHYRGSRWESGNSYSRTGRCPLPCPILFCYCSRFHKLGQCLVPLFIPGSFS